jgi:hypothetical protein
MKKLILNEGRVEELIKKYIKYFEDREHIFELIISNQDLKNLNHKYTNFILKNIHNKTSLEIRTNLEDIIYNIILFDKYNNILDKKDINQYANLEELSDALEPIINKEETKFLQHNTEKIYEDSRYLVILPKTKEAACKYGSNTKWCVASKNSSHFNQYTAGKQKLYYVIDKKNSTDDFFSKIAVHYDDYGNRTLWNSKDVKLSEKEIRILEYAFPTLLKSIDDDRNSFNFDENYITKLFSKPDFYDSKLHNDNNQDYNLIVSIGYSSEIDDYTVAFDCNINVINDGITFDIGSYFVYCNYSLEKNLLSMDFILEDFDTIDIGLNNYEFNLKLPLIEDVKEMDKKIKKTASFEIMDEIFRDKNKLKKIDSYVRDNK